MRSRFILLLASILCAGIVTGSGKVFAADETPAELKAVREHFQAGRYAEAEETLDEWKSFDEKHRAAVLILRSEIYREQGKYREAAKILAEFATRKETLPHAGILAHQGQIELLCGNLQSAGEFADAAIKVDPDQPLARWIQAETWTATGKLKEAAEGYRWFVRFYNRKQPTDAETLLIVGKGSLQYARWNLLTQKNASQVFDFTLNTLCVDALKDSPKCWQAKALSGELLLEKYNKAQGMPELEAALKINPRAADVHAAIARSAAADYNWKRVEECAARAFETFPNCPEALQAQADAAIHSGDLAAAMKHLSQAKLVNPHHPETTGRLAALFLLIDGLPSTTRIKTLFEHLDAIANLPKDDAKPEKPASRFEALFVEVATINPHPGQFLTAVGQTLELVKKYELAEKFYRQAILSMPQLSAPRTELGMLCMTTGQLDQARKILDDAFKADPFHVRVSNMRKVLSHVEKYETISSPNFIVRVDAKQDHLLGRYMSRYLEEIYPELTQKFGYQPDSRTQFEIYNKSESTTAHQWFSARMVGLPWVQTIGASTGKIVAMASPSSMEHPVNWARVLKHEFVHVLTLQQTQFNIPHWYTEALAVTSEGYPRPTDWNAMLLDRFTNKRLRNLDNLNMGFIRAESQADWNFAYCQSVLYAEYLAERFGQEAWSKLLDAYRRNRTTEQALKEEFRVEKADFEAGYLGYVKKVVASIQAEEVVSKRTPAEIEKAYDQKPDDPQTMAEFAQVQFQSKQFKKARTLAMAAIQKEPKHPLAAIVLAELAIRGGDTSEAISRLEAGLNADAPHPQVLQMLGELFEKEKQFEKLGPLAVMGQKKFPSQSRWWRWHVLAANEKKDVAGVKTGLEYLVLHTADDPGPRKQLARIALAEKNWDDALKYGRMVLQIDVLDEDVHELLGEAYAKISPAKKLESAEEFGAAVEIAESEKSDKLPDLRLRWAKALWSAGEQRQAKEQLTKFLTEKPDFPEALELQKEWK